MPEATDAPVDELDGLPSLSPDLISRTTQERAASSAADELLCAKGWAAATRSRSSDHKDAFEPAQGATAPPSDADEFGSWLKYDGAVPAGRARALSEDDRPTSWSKYEAKPIASLLGSVEKPRPKARIDLGESAPAVTAALPEVATEIATAPEMREPPHVDAPPEPSAPSEPPPDEPIGLEAPAIALGVFEEMALESAAPSPEDPPLATAETAVSTPEPESMPESAGPSLTAAGPQQDTEELLTPQPTDPPELPETEAPPIRVEAPAVPEVAAEHLPVPAPLDPIEAHPVETDTLRDDRPSIVPHGLQPADAEPVLDVLEDDSSLLPVATGPVSEPIPGEPLAPAIPLADPPSTVPTPTKKAMLARLAEMLEQALAAKPATAPASAERETERSLESEVAVNAETIQEPPPEGVEESQAASLGAVQPLETGGLGAEPPSPPPLSDQIVTEDEPHQNTDTQPEAIETIAESSGEVEVVSLVEAETIAPVAEAPRPEPTEALAAAPEPEPHDLDWSDEVPSAEPALTPPVAAAEPTNTARKALLARLAGMLERALTKRAASARAPATTRESVTEVAGPAADEAPSAVADAPAEPVTEPFASDAPTAFSEPDTVMLEVGGAEALGPTPDPEIAIESAVSATGMAEMSLAPQAERSDLAAFLPASAEEPAESRSTVVHADPLPEEATQRLAPPDEGSMPTTDSADPAASIDLPHEVEHDEPSASELEANVITADTNAVMEPVTEPFERDAPFTFTEFDPVSQEAGAALPPEPTQELCTASAVKLSVIDPPETDSDLQTEPSDLVADIAAFAEVPAGSESTIVQADPLPAGATQRLAPPSEGLKPTFESTDFGASSDPPRDAPSDEIDDIAEPSAVPEPGTETAVELAAIEPDTNAIPDDIDANASTDEAIRQIEDHPRDATGGALDVRSAPVAAEMPTQESIVIEAADGAAGASSEASVLPNGAVEKDVVTEPFVVSTPVDELGTEELDPPAPPPATAAEPILTPAQQEKAAREALSQDLAEMIHDVLSTTQFATKALKPQRYAEVEPLDAPELPEFAEELSASLPHPVAIKSGLGRMERFLAFASIGMLLAVGYFGVSLWRGETGAPARAPVVAITAPPSEDWGERARDMTRDLGSIAAATEVPKTQAGDAEPGTVTPDARAPQTAQ